MILNKFNSNKINNDTNINCCFMFFRRFIIFSLVLNFKNYIDKTDIIIIMLEKANFIQ